ncbi:unnamed protein product [Ilex paraguariensis]|uniref:30S ribosomal protein S20, chloroplastic n=1 Tax=Ilex paraguariensis TaxID=185542 RepID=A0ABC8UPR4_9AQUA
MGVLEELDVLKKKPSAQPEEVLSIEKLIAEAYSVIDKAVKVGTLHRNTGARRKSRLARRKKAVEIHHGWLAYIMTTSTAITVTLAGTTATEPKQITEERHVPQERKPKRGIMGSANKRMGQHQLSSMPAAKAQRNGPLEL